MGFVDQLAAGVGALCALYVFARLHWTGSVRQQKSIAQTLMFAFGNGSSAAYLGLLAFGLLCAPSIRDAVITNASVLLVGSMGYAAVINLAALNKMSSRDHRAYR